MSSIKQNKHLTSTKKRLRAAFCELLKSYDAEKITVNMLCAESEIARGTFYLYFHCMEDFIEDTEKYIIDTTFKQTATLLMAYKEDFSETALFKNSMKKQTDIFLLNYFFAYEKEYCFEEKFSKALYTYIDRFIKRFFAFTHIEVDYEKAVFYICGAVNCLTVCFREGYEAEFIKKRLQMIYGVREILFVDMLEEEQLKKIDTIIKPLASLFLK